MTETQAKPCPTCKHEMHQGTWPPPSSGVMLERLAPIAMTTLAAGLSLIIVLLMGDAPGLEIVRPMAIVVLGGLVTSTLINLFVLPSLFLRLRVAPAQDLDLASGAEAIQDELFGMPGMVAGR